MKNVKYLKFAITAFYLIASYWVTCLIFEKEFASTVMKHSVDSKYENTLVILLISTLFSAIGVFLLGLLSLFTHFVFTKLVFSNEIKHAAFTYMRDQHKKRFALNKKQITKPLESPVQSSK